MSGSTTQSAPCALLAWKPQGTNTMPAGQIAAMCPASWSAPEIMSRWLNPNAMVHALILPTTSASKAIGGTL